eukprot:TRINITY_DN6668_c0_g1_i5.p1 TRINITY_DN6668_c0_g1~~TRINITY_DN6668_c0_g1_i5.p1  ORF type:complete len:523 (+),score=136.90 TRINITY_DN6668_c0_g1_i5:214-1569(+)
MAVPLWLTSLLPIVLFPLLGVMTSDKVCSLYFNDTIFLMISSSFLGIGMEKWNLHRRIALFILALVGSSPWRLMLGFLSATAFLSMWVSNTATALMMTPMVLALLARLEADSVPEQKEHLQKYSAGLVLTVMYGVTIGGSATLTGSGPPLALQGALKTIFPDAPEVSYLQWFLFAGPICVVFVLTMWVYLSMLFIPTGLDLRLEKSLLQKQLKELGPMNNGERTILAAIVVLVVLWFTRDPGFAPGWVEMFPWNDSVTDTTPGMFVAMFLFVIPVNRRENVLDVSCIASLPWGSMMLIGCGFAISAAFVDSGLSEIISDALIQLDDLDPLWIMVTINTTMLALTEFISNTSAVSILAPIISDVAVGVRVNPFYLLIPSTMCATYAFLFPIGAPANSIVFDSGKVSLRQMAIAGILPNIFGIFLVTAMMSSLGLWVYDVDLNDFPDWAERTG